MSLSRLLDQALELKWLRALDVQFARMVATEDNPALMLAAALLSHDAGEGHVCLPLSRLRGEDLFSGRAPELAMALLTAAGDPLDWPCALLSSPAVSSDDSATPIKLIDNRLYLNRLWRNELQVADFFGAHNHAIVRDEEPVRAILDTLFGVKSETDWQKVAAAVALSRRISVISGGPGTGKTTTVAKLLVALVQLSMDKPVRIQLTAPTGKAAARLTESLGRSLRDLSLDESVKKRLPEDACTLHRLLGAQRHSQTFRHHAGNPLHLDVLVVDEASMVDLPMMSRLISALPDHTQVIFLGDRDQLASVEAGAVLGDICHYVNQGYSANRASQLQRLTGCEVSSSAIVREGALADSLCLLRKSYRFDNHSGIGQLARAVNSSDTKSMTAILAGGYQDLTWRKLQAKEDYAQMIDDIVAGYRDFLRQVHDRAEPGDIIRAFERYQVLCALRSGPFGVAGLNERIERALASANLITLPAKSASRWYHGRPVMIARNEGSLGLFNGDIGIALQHQDGLRVWFPMPDGSIKSFQPARLPQHDTAWAMTVHKSQGSEFDHVALVLPNQFTPVLTRELVYTAITRAKKHLSLYADKQPLYKAVATKTDRRSGLMAIFADSSSE